MILVKMEYVTNLLFSFVLLLLLVLSLAFGDCGPEFGGKCSCGKGEYEGKNEQYIVNCTNTGFNSTSVLHHIPPETQVCTKYYTQEDNPTQCVWIERSDLEHLNHINIFILIFHFCFS
jgi:hypothetical protein